MTATVAIAGGGLMGRLLGWQLLHLGYRVTVFDAGAASGESSAAYVAAAMLAPYTEAVGCGAHLLPYCHDALSQWQVLLEQLQRDTGLTVELNARGTIVVAHARDHSDLQLFRQRLKHCVGESENVRDLAAAELAGLEPDLVPRFKQAVMLENEGSLDNRALLGALHQAIVSLGGCWHENAPVVELGAGFVRLHQALKVEQFDWVVDCRGFGARADWPQLRGVRGEVLWVKAPEVALRRPVRLMHPRYHLYITPKPESVYVVGATEIESESEAPVTVRSELELLSALYTVHSGFAEATLLGSYARCRPALPDNLPRVLLEPGRMQLNGLYRHGFLLGPALLEAALRAFSGQGAHDFIEQGSVENRFAENTVAEKREDDSDPCKRSA